MGRPREHDEHTAVALLDAAERIVSEHGLGAVSVRGLADEVGTSTRAVYSLFGSKEGLVSALGARTFDLLGGAVRALPTSDDAAADLIRAGMDGFRRLVVEHPALFAVGVQQVDVQATELPEIRVAAGHAWTSLLELVVRLEQQRGLGGRTAHEAATSFHALCEGLAALELRCMLPPNEAERLWRGSLAALVDGLTRPAQR